MDRGVAKQMLVNTNPQIAGAAVNEIARCFKAKDMNLIRANQFLAYVRTGQGESPLKTF